MTSLARIEHSTETSPHLHAENENWGNNRVDKSLHSLTLYQLLKEIYSQTIDAKATKILWPVKSRSLGLVLRAKEALLKRKVRSNIYNNLILTWLELNMPFKGSYTRYNVFKNHIEKKIQPKIIDELTLNNFYQNAAGVWESMIDPSFEEIKNACVIIVAKAITFPKYNELGEVFSDFFLTLINKHEELLSLEEFIYLVKNYQKDIWPDEHECRNMCFDFYTFGKRFILVDFPLSSTGLNLSKLGQVYLKDKLAQGIDNSFKFLEDNIEKFAQKRYHVNLDSSSEDSDNKNIYVQRSLALVSKFSKTKKLVVKDFIFRVKENRIYSYVNRTFKVEQRYYYSLELVAKGKSVIRTRLLNPLFSLVSFSIDRTRNTAIFVLNGIEDKLELGAKYQHLISKYKYLKTATLKRYKNMMEIHISLDILKYYSQDLKEELISLYHELKTLDAEKIIALPQTLYQKALDKLKKQKKPLRVIY